MSISESAGSAELLEKLQETERRFRTMADIAPVCLWMSGVDAKCNYFNQTWLNFTGRALEQEAGDGWLEGVHPEDSQYCIQTYLSAFKEHRNFQMEYRLRRADGQYRWILDTGTPRYLPNGVFEGYIGSCIDITELKESHEVLERAVAARTSELREVIKELEAFSYSVSHDLKAPLRSIDGFSEILERKYIDHFDERGKQYLQWIRNGSKRMGELIDDILNLSRLMRAEMQVSKVDLSALAKKVAEDIKKGASKRDVVFQIKEGLVADVEGRLMQIVFENLFQNSLKYTSTHPKARIEFGMIGQSQNCVYYIRDDGVGFSPELAKTLFVPFRRLHSDSQFPGNGVGLTIVRRIIERHSGRIWAEGAVEQGMTVFFTLQKGL